LTAAFELFRALLVDHLENTDLFPRKHLHVDLILNPSAGAFRSRARVRALLAGLKTHRDRGIRGAGGRTVKVSTWTTDYPGHEREILAHLQDTDPCGPNEQRLVITAGGDGTSRGALISALGLPGEVRRGLLFFRLPLGTGNDAADAPTWVDAMEVLSGRGRPVSVKPLPVIEVRAAGEPVHQAFNIASFGLDAFVSHLTNRLKSWLPGNSYKVMVDAAAFFYEAFVRVVPCRLVLEDGGRTVVDWNDRFLLAALGASGRRTYGGGIPVLPDDDNFCLAGKKNLLTKLAYRQPFYRGTHRGLAGITLAKGQRLTVRSPVRMPLQMDGEVLWLDPGAFPVVLTVEDRGLFRLCLAGSSGPI